MVIIGVGVEIEHRLRLPRGQAGELDERLVENRRLPRRARSGRRVERIQLLPKTAESGAAIRPVESVDTNERPQGAPGRLGPGVEFDAAQGGEVSRIARAGIGIFGWQRNKSGAEMLGAIGVKERADNAEGGIEAAQLGQRQAADPQTCIGARNIEEAGAIGVANADIFNRRRLARRKIGGASARHRNHSGQRRRTPEEVLGTVSCPIPARRISSSLRFQRSRSGRPLPEGIVFAFSVSSRSEPFRLYIKSARPPMASGFDSGSVSLLAITAA